MPRSKSSSKESLELVSDNEDTNSQCSTLSLTPSLSDEPLKENLESIIDALSEKRGEIRELNLKKLKKILGSQLISEELENQIDTIQDVLLRCLKKSKSNTERILVAQVFTVLYVTLGMDHTLKMNELHDFLVENLSSMTSEPVIDSWLYLYAIAHFISDAEEESKALLAPFFETMLLKYSSSLLTFGVLSTLTKEAPTDKLLQLHLKCLSLSPTLKVAATFNFALFNELEVLPSAMKLKVLNLLQTEETSSVKQVAQQDRKLLKSSLPSLLASLEQDAEPPEEKLQFGKHFIILSSREKQLQFELFRQGLGSALQFHVLHNPLLQSIFDLGNGAGSSRSASTSSLNKLEKKMYFNPSSKFNKERTLALSKQRKQKTSKSQSQLWT